MAGDIQMNRTCSVALEKSELVATLQVALGFVTLSVAGLCPLSEVNFRHKLHTF